MRIGVFGGSFDPIHRGHMALAESCLRQAKLDRVLLIPAARQPLKPQGPVASNEDRLAMARLAAAIGDGLAASSLEIDRQGVSYTIDTLRAVADGLGGASHCRDELFLLMGADSLADFPAWRDPRGILALATPLVVPRCEDPFAPHRISKSEFRESLIWAFGSFVDDDRLQEILAAPPVAAPPPISSSGIRQLIAKGGEWASLVPESVAAYIREKTLYLLGQETGG